MIYPYSKEEGQRELGDKMRMELDTRKSNLGSQKWLRFHTWFIMTFLLKMRQSDSYFITN